MAKDSYRGRVLGRDEVAAVEQFLEEGWSAGDVRAEPRLAEVVLEYVRDLIATVKAERSSTWADERGVVHTKGCSHDRS